MSESTDIVNEVIEGRRGVYGEPTNTYPRTAAMWQAIVDGNEIQSWHVPLMMIAAKIIRTAEQHDYSDNSDDIEGYLAIFRELVGDDMIHARSVDEFLAKRAERDGQ